MWHRFLFAVLLGIAFVLIAFAALFVPGLSAAAELILEPGYAPLKWLAGGGDIMFHDLLPLFLVILLNLGLYGLVFWLVLEVRAYVKRGRA